MKAICASGPSPKAARQESVINRRAGLPRHHVAPCDKGGTAKRTSRHQKGGRTMTHHGLTRLAALLATGVATRLAALLATGVATSCFMTVPAHAQETVYSFDIPAISEEHTSEFQSLMRTSYAVSCSKKKNI